MDHSSLKNSADPTSPPQFTSIVWFVDLLPANSRELAPLRFLTRLVICSVDKAREMGMDWWVNNPVFCGQPQTPQLDAAVLRMEERLARLETALGTPPSAGD